MSLQLIGYSGTIELRDIQLIAQCDDHIQRLIAQWLIQRAQHGHIDHDGPCQRQRRTCKVRYGDQSNQEKTDDTLHDGCNMRWLLCNDVFQPQIAQHD